jgi:hypothetical protein
MSVDNKLGINWLNLDVPVAGLSWPLFIGGQVSRIWSGSIQISLYEMDYNMTSIFRL